MEKQFKFSVIVGGLLVALGAIIASQSSVGVSLMGVGAVIAVLACVTRQARLQDVEARLMFIPFDRWERGEPKKS